MTRSNTEDNLHIHCFFVSLIWGTNQRHQAHLHHPSHKHRAQILCKLSPVLEAGQGSACHISSGYFILLTYTFRLFNARCTVYIIFSLGRKSHPQIWLMPYLVVLFFCSDKAQLLSVPAECRDCNKWHFSSPPDLPCFFPFSWFFHPLVLLCNRMSFFFCIVYGVLLSREQTMGKGLLGGRAAKKNLIWR